MAKEIHTLNFEEEVLRNPKPAVIDFWAQRCSTCQVVGSLIDDLDIDYDGRVTIGKVDVDKYPRIAEHFGVVSIPSILFLKKGNVIHRMTGTVSKREIVEEIERMLI
ncbi:thioredoxin family protein [Perlabentimonas gracilis]|uniref:thioredoxin family protein n=1 Tax=Perlabentimonas gracilis TaxID=2715279 RepID=UPI0014091DD6|nr:thioredoxin domain-containing protein [Perlabentimonas gracilis]NHB70358.1 thiol reductase thioredoxin [Perlabentimonas gracilis]